MNTKYCSSVLLIVVIILISNIDNVDMAKQTKPTKNGKNFHFDLYRINKKARSMLDVLTKPREL